MLFTLLRTLNKVFMLEGSSYNDMKDKIYKMKKKNELNGPPSNIFMQTKAYKFLKENHIYVKREVESDAAIVADAIVSHAEKADISFLNHRISNFITSNNIKDNMVLAAGMILATESNYLDTKVGKNKVLRIIKESDFSTYTEAINAYKKFMDV